VTCDCIEGMVYEDLSIIRRSPIEALVGTLTSNLEVKLGAKRAKKLIED
jgi:hypothetical protein